MTKLSQQYPFAMNIIYTVITLLVAVVLTIFNSEAIIVPTLGLGLVVYAFYQLYQLLSKPAKKSAFKVLLIEIFGQIVIGAILIYIGFFADFSLGVFFGYLLGGILIVRGTLYLYAREDDKELSSFLIHVAAIIAGTYLIIQGDFTANVVSGMIIAVALKRSLKTGYKAYKLHQNRTIEAPQEIEQPKTNEKENSPNIESIQWKE